LEEPLKEKQNVTGITPELKMVKTGTVGSKKKKPQEKGKGNNGKNSAASVKQETRLCRHRTVESPKNKREGGKNPYQKPMTKGKAQKKKPGPR